MANRFWDGVQATAKIFGMRSLRAEFADLRADGVAAFDAVQAELDGVVGVDATETDEDGGDVALVGGLADGTGVGGDASLLGGDSGGASGTAGSVVVDAGDPDSGTEGAVSIGVTNADAVLIGNAASLITLAGIPTYADDAAAKSGGLTEGQLYKTSAGVLGIVLA